MAWPRDLNLDGQVGRKDIHGSKPTLTQCAQAESVVALGEAPAIVIHDQAAVVPGGVAEAEETVEQNLPRSGFEEIGAAHRLSDLHCGIIGNAR